MLHLPYYFPEDTLIVSNQTLKDVHRKKVIGDGNTILGCSRCLVIGDRNVITNGEETEIQGNFNLCNKMKQSKLIGRRNVFRGEQCRLEGFNNVFSFRGVGVSYGGGNVREEEPKVEPKVEHKMDQVGDECVVCVENSQSHVIVPCFHLCLCEDCVDVVKKAGTCPICRGEIKEIKKIFKV